MSSSSGRISSIAALCASPEVTASILALVSVTR